jgi:hypothetical protein
MSERILPSELVMRVDLYVDKELHDARKYDNREPFDYSGIYSLHSLAAEIYASGWRDGERAQATREQAQRYRDREAKAGA